MAEHAQKADSMAEGNSEPEETDSGSGSRKPNIDWGSVKDQFVGLLAAAVRWVCVIFALILVLHVVFTVAEANTDNAIVSNVNEWAGGLTLGFADMFQPDDAKLEVLVNYGIAAMFWLIVSALGANLIRRVGAIGNG